MAKNRAELCHSKVCREKNDRKRSAAGIAAGLASVLLVAAAMAGCSGASVGETFGRPVKESVGLPSEADIAGSPANTLHYEVAPEHFSLSIRDGAVSVPVSLPGESRRVEHFVREGDETRWEYPDEQIAVSVRPEEDYLRVTVTSKTGKDNNFRWPEVRGDAYYIPLGEGKRIPGEDPAWLRYLDGKKFSALEQLSMPFWAAVQGEQAVLYIMENPYRSELVFTGEDAVRFGLVHRYPEIDGEKENHFRIYVTDDNPVSAAKQYRRYVEEQGRFVTLEQKAEENPNVRKLYGAPQIYLWGEYLIAPGDIDWPVFLRSMDSRVFSHLAGLAAQTETGGEALEVFRSLEAQNYVDQYQKNVICRFLSEAMRLENFYDPQIFPVQGEAVPVSQKTSGESGDAALNQSSAGSSERRPDRSSGGSSSGSMNESDRIQRNKRALAASLPEVFHPAMTWMDGGTVELLRELKAAGIDRAWIGLNSWEQAYAKPELVETAVDEGYLIGPYDSYHSIHKPGEEQWITARFEDKSLYGNAAVIKKDGTWEEGFQGVGRKLNPTLSLPAVKQRVGEILETGLPFNSWFIDCDATGEIYDDYAPEHVTTQQEDLAARLGRMAYIRDSGRMVIGSEGGNDFAAPVIAFAHGIELPSFSWMDEDMKSNKDSEYYIGRYYSTAGGVAEHFSRRIPVKEEYYPIFLDPRYDLPLFKLVYNDSVITGYHWDWPTFKVIGSTADRMLREILYNTPPLYHLDEKEWENYKDEIATHTKLWSRFSRQAVTREMEDFRYLTEDGTVQMSRYGADLIVTANFGDSEYTYSEGTIPGHSLLLHEEGKSTLYTPYHDTIHGIANHE